MTRKLIIALTILALAALGLAACGDDDSSSGDTAATTTEEETTTTEETTASGGKGGTIDVVADPGGALAYTSGDLEVDSGSVEVAFDNPASLGHDVRIEDSSGADVGGTSVISESSETATVDLEPGEYVYYCSVGGHRAGGMEQTLTVK